LIFFGFFFLATKQTDQCSQVTGINFESSTDESILE